jgi:hypothetical protein
LLGTRLFVRTVRIAYGVAYGQGLSHNDAGSIEQRLMHHIYARPGQMHAQRPRAQQTMLPTPPLTQQ